MTNAERASAWLHANWPPHQVWSGDVAKALTESLDAVRDEGIVDAMHDLEDEDHLQCERRNADEPCDVCVPCVARLKYQQAWDRVADSIERAG